MSQWVNAPDSDVVLITNSLKYHAHQKRVEGFPQVMALKAPQVKVHGPIECFENDTLIEQSLKEIYRSGRGLTGVNTTGSGSGVSNWLWHIVIKDRSGLATRPLSSMPV